jgi:hypothetical protein
MPESVWFSSFRLHGYYASASVLFLNIGGASAASATAWRAQSTGAWRAWRRAGSAAAWSAKACPAATTATDIARRLIGYAHFTRIPLGTTQDKPIFSNRRDAELADHIAWIDDSREFTLLLEDG